MRGGFERWRDTVGKTLQKRRTWQTLRDWVHRYNEFGPEELNDRPKSGRKVFLDEGQLKVVSDWLEKGPDPETDGLVRWRVQDIKNKIQTNFGVKYSMEGTRRAEAGLPSRFAASASGKAQGSRGIP